MPLDCIFQDQFDYLDHLYDKINNEELLAAEVPHSPAKRVLLLSFILAYLSSNNATFRKIFYLTKATQEAKDSVHLFK